MFRAPALGQAFALLALALIAGAPTLAGSPRAALSPLSPALTFHPADSAGVVLFALDAPAPAEPEPAADLPAEPDTPDEEPTDPADSPPADPPRPHPLRAYAVPPARVAQWGFTPEVTRWLPLVETELAALRARRLDHPELVPELVLAVIDAESAGDPLALSEADAIGLMQLLPSTFSDMIPAPAPSPAAGADQLPDPPDPFDPVLNVRAGILYLRLLLIRHDGDVAWAVAGYHAGINASARARWEEQPLYDVTLDYVAQVLTLRERGVPPATAVWASFPAWPPSVPRPLSAASEPPEAPQAPEAPEAPEPAPPEVQLDAGPTITDAEPAPTDPTDSTDPTTELPARDEVPDMPDEPPATPVPGSPPLATPVAVRSDAPESQTEREDGRDLTVRRAAVSASPSPSPSPSASPSLTATAVPPTATPSPTRTPNPTSSPTATASPTAARRP